MTCDVCFCLGSSPCNVHINGQESWRDLCDDCRGALEEMGAEVEEVFFEEQL